jgi:hypothetical protein
MQILGVAASRRRGVAASRRLGGSAGGGAAARGHGSQVAASGAHRARVCLKIQY